jgi:hypothetical protein
VGYKNPVITLRFDDLVEDGDTCHVIIRNPRTMPGSQFTAMAAGGDMSEDDAKMHRVHEMIAGLVIGWRVWDPTVPVKADPETGELIHDEETTPRLLPLPATPENVAKLPQEIQMAIMGKVTEAVNPPQSPASQEATGNPS